VVAVMQAAVWNSPALSFLKCEGTVWSVLLLVKTLHDVCCWCWSADAVEAAACEA
jgi:hypothetical protein